MATITVRYQVQLARLRARTSQAVGSAWEGLPAYYDVQIAPFVESVAPIVRGAQQAAVSLTDAYLALRLQRDPFGLTIDDIDDSLRGPTVAVEDVYTRPFATVWKALANGAHPSEAIRSGLERAMSTAETDVQLATRGSARESMRRDDRVVGYERVPDGGACALCLMASTQRYHTEDLQPIHNRCGCTVEPLTGTRDPGLVSDRDLLRQLKESGVATELSYQQARMRARDSATNARDRAAGAREELKTETDPDRRERLTERAQSWDQRATSADAKAEKWDGRLSDFREQQDKPPIERFRDEVAIREHGELGPVLTNKSDAFAGPSDV